MRVIGGITKAKRTKFSFQGHQYPIAVHPGGDWVSTRITSQGFYGNVGALTAAAKEIKGAGE